jgi:hypothetical protein
MLADRTRYAARNTVGFALSTVSDGTHYPDSRTKIAKRLEMPTDRVLGAPKLTVLHPEQTG